MGMTDEGSGGLADSGRSDNWDNGFAASRRCSAVERGSVVHGHGGLAQERSGSS